MIIVNLYSLPFLHTPNIPLICPFISLVKSQHCFWRMVWSFLTHFFCFSSLVTPKHGNFSDSLTLYIYLQSASRNDNPPDTVPAVFLSEMDSLKRGCMFYASTFKIHKPGRFSGIMHERVLQFDRGGSIWVTLITVSSSGSEARRTSSHRCSTTAGNFTKLGKVQLADLIAGRFRVWFQGRGLPVVLLARWGGRVISNRGTWPNVYAIIQLWLTRVQQKLLFPENIAASLLLIQMA